MFGKGLPVRERFANFMMDYLDMTNLSSPEERYSDRLTYDGRWENNFYQEFLAKTAKESGINWEQENFGTPTFSEDLSSLEKFAIFVPCMNKGYIEDLFF